MREAPAAGVLAIINLQDTSFQYLIRKTEKWVKNELHETRRKK